jgi:hypothetical protein
MGTPELLVLIGVPLLIILPIWMSFRIYKNDRTLWKQLSCVASLFGSWVGFVIVRCIHQAYKGYQDQKRADAKK